MKILSNSRMREIDIYTHRIHTISNNEKITENDRDIILANADAIRSVCKLPYIRRVIHPIPMPKVELPKKEECKHIFEIAFYEKGIPFLFCKHCAKIVDLHIGKKQEGEA